MTTRRLMYLYDRIADRLHVGWERSFDSRPLQAAGAGTWVGVDDDRTVGEVVIDFVDGEWPAGSLHTLEEAFGAEACRWISGIPRTNDTRVIRDLPALSTPVVAPHRRAYPGEPGLPVDNLSGVLVVPLAGGHTMTIRRYEGSIHASIDSEAARNGAWLVVSHRHSGELLGMCEVTPHSAHGFAASLSFAPQIPTSALHFQLTNEPLSPPTDSTDRRRAWLADLLASGRADLWKAPQRAATHAATAAAVAGHLNDQQSLRDAERLATLANRWRVGRWIAPLLILGVSAVIATASWNDEPVPAPGTTTYFENCDAARAAGPTPLIRTDPGYRPGLDRDNDGLACE